MRRARKIDNNHQAIRLLFEQNGFHTHSTRGDWDLTVQSPSRNVTCIVEVKDGKAPLTENEENWHEKLLIFIVRSEEDAQALMTMMLKHDVKIRAGT